MNQKVENGTIFVNRENKFYKVISYRIIDQNRNLDCYECVSCSITGKEYKTKNWYCTSFVEGLHKEGKTWKATVDAGKKANIENSNKIGAKKRRIKYLKALILNSQKELNKLEQEISVENKLEQEITGKNNEN